ncbi:MAG: AzlD domain-containing protein [Clostridia bacterium]|nr:AzlD domain-containing protein [Clostridia bacterium]
MTTERVILFIVIMATVTYLCRVLTMVLVRKKIGSTFVRSFLTYAPYGILAAMVFPGIIYSTSSGGVIESYAVLIATIVGTLNAITLSLLKRGLFTVSMSSVAIVIIMILILNAAGVA